MLTFLTMNGFHGGHIGLLICLTLAAWLIEGIGTQSDEQGEPEQSPEGDEARFQYEQAAAEFEMHSAINSVIVDE